MVKQKLGFALLLGLALSGSVFIHDLPALADEESSAIFSIVSKAKDMANEENFQGAEETFKSISQQRADDLAIEYKQKFREKLDELASLFLKKNLYAEAESLYLSRLEPKKEDYGSDDCRFMANIALINLQAGKEAEAEKYNKEALDISIKQCGPDNVKTAREGKNKSDELWKAGQKKEALEETLKVTENILKKHEGINYKPYMTGVQKSIRQNWFPPKSEQSTHVTLRFKVLSNGQVSRLKVVQSAGENECDKAALAAVEKAKPFSPLPKYAPHDLDIEFTLDYNVH